MNQRRAVRVGLLLVLVLACLPLPAFAWGPLGHNVIAGLAQNQLTPAARAAVAALLQPDNERTLVDVATWADDLRDSDPARFRDTSKLHYVNFASAQCNYVAQRDCRKGECVVAAIERYRRALADTTRPRQERADALRFVVHFIADVHQPLHASFKRDKGGNTVQLRYGRDSRNLHSVWDSLLLNSADLRWPQYVERLSQQAAAVDTRTDAAEWAAESCRIVRDGDIYPQGTDIDDAYVAAQRPVEERRLREAASRLAEVLNTILR